MEPAQYAAFLGVSLLVICTPGQDTALTIRNTLAGGRRAGVATALGVSSGQTVWSMATAAGLAVVLAQSAALFTAIRFAGAAYLIYLGTRSLLNAVRRDRPAIEAARPAQATRRAGQTAFAQGLVSNLANPKMVAFFIGFLPAFSGAHPTLVVVVGLGLNFSLLTLAWLAGYAYAVERAGRWLRLARVRRALDATLGTVLLAFGLRVASEAG